MISAYSADIDAAGFFGRSTDALMVGFSSDAQVTLVLEFENMIGRYYSGFETESSLLDFPISDSVAGLSPTSK